MTMSHQLQRIKIRAMNHLKNLKNSMNLIRMVTHLFWKVQLY